MRLHHRANRLCRLALSREVDLAIVALVVTFGAGHFAQLLARHAFLQSEHLRTSRERLAYDLQRLEYRLSGSSTTRLPTAVTPTESSASTTISAAPQQGLRNVRSAPAVMDGEHNAFLAGLVLCRWPPPHATHPSTAGPSTAGPSTASPSTTDPSTASAPLSAFASLSASAPPPLPPPSASAPLHPSPPLDDRALLNATVQFTMFSEDRARRSELVAQMESERQELRQEDEASDALSQHGGAPEMPWGSWSTSDPSTATRNRRRMIRAIYELRRGISSPANAAAARRCPYI